MGSLVAAAESSGIKAVHDVPKRLIHVAPVGSHTHHLLHSNIAPLTRVIFADGFYVETMSLQVDGIDPDARGGPLVDVEQIHYYRPFIVTDAVSSQFSHGI